MCPRPATSPADIPPSRMEMTSSRPHTPRHGDEDEEDPSPPESRASPSFSFHEEKRMLKSDEYFLSHKLARLPPAALSISTSPSASMYLDPLASPSYTMNQHRPLQLDEEEEAYAAKDDEEPESSSQAFPGKRRSTMLSPSGVENGDLDPAGILIHRVERDKDERLDLEEEKRERAIDGMSPIPLENDRVNNPQFDTVKAFAESGVGSELEALYAAFSKCLELRDKYIELSGQRLGDNPRDHDGTFNGFVRGTGDVMGCKPDMDPNTTQLPSDPKDKRWQMNPPPPPPHWKWTAAADGPVVEQNVPAVKTLGGIPDVVRRGSQTALDRFSRKDCDVPGPEVASNRCRFELNDEGVFMVYPINQEEVDTSTKAEVDANGNDVKPAPKPLSRVPRLKEYYSDLEYLLDVCSDGPAKSFAFRRLKYLSSKWTLYTLLNEYQELADMKAVPHRDFYNVRKVDTHIHHSASMNQKHLLRFIKSKLRKSPNETVIHRDGKDLTLAEVFESLNLTAYDLSIDTLDMHAHQEFHRFDRFNNRYNPTGSSRLREIFLKTDNLLQGKYLAELTQELITDMEQSKYQNVEWRLSIYGRNMNEWDKLAKWVINNELVSHNVRWLIQVPRLYEVFKGGGLVNNFEDIVKNVFQPLFEVTADPTSHPELHIFLQRVIGFDSVDDESKPERRLYRKFPTAQMWDTKQSPPYSYWIYYMYANIASLNSWRRKRGFSTFVLRPHCGEAGDPDHLSSAFLTSHSISHGILLRKVPALQYLFYLKQIGLAMSPLSNNALFLTYERNPFKDFFKVGMNVSLSTDDPLQFHFTAQHLLEEFSCATQIYKLTAADMCELARNSVVQSGWEMQVKKHWIGSRWFLPGAAGNDIHKTNVPNIRLAYRHATLLEELTLIQHGRMTPSHTPGPMTPVNPAAPPSPGPAAAAPAANGSPSAVAAAAIAQTKAMFDGAHPELGPGASVLHNRHRKRSQSNLQANRPSGPSGLHMTRPQDGDSAEDSAVDTANGAA